MGISNWDEEEKLKKLKEAFPDDYPSEGKK